MTSSDGRRHVRPRCSICGKRIRHDKAQTTTSAGETAHADCLSAPKPRETPKPRVVARRGKTAPTCGMCSKPIWGKGVDDGHGPVHWGCLPANRGGKAPQPRRTVPAPARTQRPASRQPVPETPPGVQTAAPVISAARPGRCPWCEKSYPVKARLAKTPMGWVHEACSPLLLAQAEHARNKAAVESGDTFRSRAPSTWRRKTPTRNA